MIRIPGIQGKLKMIVKPKSGFRIRVLLLQTPFHFSGLVGDGPVEDDNAGSLPSDEDPMGSFRPSLEHMSQIVENEEGMVRCSLNPRFAPLFDRQMPVMNDMNFHDEIAKMKVTHPNVLVLADRHMFVKNRKNRTCMFNWSFFRKMNTTIRYPLVNYGGFMQRVRANYEDVPDRKIFALVLVTPAREQYEVPPSKKMVVPGDLEPGDETVRSQVRFSSVVSDRLPTIEEATEERGGGAGPSSAQITRSKGKGRAGVGTAGGNEDDSSSEEEDTGDDKMKIDYDKMRQVFVGALNDSQQIAKREREEERQEKKDKEGDEVFTSVWAEDQGMLMQPTFNVWFKDMPQSMGAMVVQSKARRYRYRR